MHGLRTGSIVPARFNLRVIKLFRLCHRSLWVSTGGDRDGLSSSTVAPRRCGRIFAGLDVRTYSACFSRSRRRSGHRQPINTASHGDCRLWRRGIDRGRGPHRVAEAKVLKTHSSAAPDAGHARHDHRAARPEFLHIGCIAHPNRVRAWIIARVNTVRLGQVAGINPNPPRRTDRLCKRLSRRGLRGSRALRRDLRFGARRQQRTSHHQAA